MKLLLILSMIFISAACNAKPSEKDNDINKSFKNYGAITWAWNINKRCNYLSAKESKEFDKNIAPITFLLGKHPENRKIVFAIQKSGKELASSPKYSKCGTDVKKNVLKIFESTKKWASHISSVEAGSIKVIKKQWLGSLKTITINNLCDGEKSPFRKGYKGSECHIDVSQLYEKCTTKVENVVIPGFITSVKQANTLGSIVAECINSYHHGGETLKAFNLIQELASSE